MKTLTTLLLMLTTCACMAQEAPFKQLRYDEDYSYLRKDTSADWYHRLKFYPLNKTCSTYVSYGGEVRYQYFHFENPGWGSDPADKDGFVLSRFLGNADLHAGKYFRTFIQLQSSLADGETETPSPVDRNPLELHQAFFDIALMLQPQSSLIFRGGRQELSYGSQRLVAVREAPNNRQSFDAAKIMYAAKNFKLDAFYGNYVQAQPGVFDDGFNKNSEFWGTYAVFNKVPIVQNIDVYYFGLWKKKSVFDDGVAKEMRHSVGARIWQTKGEWQYDVEGLYQFGKFGTSDISAWTASANVSYTFTETVLKPQLGLKAEAISGDKNYHDNRLNTFNPLFPKGAYFGLAALIGPYNLTDAHPYIQLNLTKNLTFMETYDMFWRMDKNDGLYAVNGRLLYSGKNIAAKNIGHQLESALEYTPNKYLYFREEFTWFKAGEFLKEAGPGKDILMAGTTVTLKF